MYRFLLIGLFLVSGASLAQQTALRVIPDAPRADLRAYLEIDLPPCRVQATETTLQSPLVMAVRITTRACLAGAIDVGKTVVPLVIFPSGEVRLDITVDGGARSLSFAVGASQLPNPQFISPDPGTAAARMERVDRSLNVLTPCPRILGAVVNDARTEIDVDIVSPTQAVLCPAAAPVTTARIGFPQLGHHVLIVRDEGLIRNTQWIIVEKGLDKLDYTDLWSVQGEDGWGLTIQQHDKDRLFAVIYGYRAGGRPIWLSLQRPDWDTATRARGSLLYTRGTPQSGPYEPPRPQGTTGYCEATLEFQSADTAILTMRCASGAVDFGLPAERSWTIKRLAF